MNVPTRIWPRRIIRLMAGFLLISWPMIKTGVLIPVPAAVLGALIAYEGTENISVIHWAIFLLFVELIYAIDVGLLSLAFVLSLGMISFFGHWVNLQSWSHEHGWSPIGFMRALVVALTAAILISVLSVLIGSLVHGHDVFLHRFRLVFGSWYWWGSGTFIAAIMIILLRWADEPLRKRITYGV